MGVTAPARLTQDDGFLTVPQAMRALGVSRGRLLSLIIRGDLAAKQTAGQLFVSQGSLGAYKAGSPPNLGPNSVSEARRPTRRKRL